MTRRGKRQLPITNRGFTLTEILAVVFVVAVLITLLLTGVRPVQESAKKAKCIGNLKALGGALGSYYADTGTIFDRSPVVKNPAGFLHQFSLSDGEPSERLLSYLDDDPRVFFCPANNQSRSPKNEYKKGQWLYSTYLFCFDTYGGNGNWSANGLSAPRRIDPIGANAAQTPMVTDMVATKSGDPYFLSNHLKKKGEPPECFYVLFVDGHVSDHGIPTEKFWGEGNPVFHWPKKLLDDVKKLQQK